MRKAILFLGVLFLTLPTGTYGQLGKFVPIAAGSAEAKALDDINASTEPAQKLKLIDQFAADFGKGDMEIVADELYVNHFLSVKNYDKVFEYGEKLWVIDPDNFQNGINLLRAAQEKGDTARIFTYGERMAAVLQSFRASPTPEGKSAEAWKHEKETTVADQKGNIDYVGDAMFASAYRTEDPAARADFLQRLAGAYPDSRYAKQSLAMAAAAYQQAQQYSKMLNLANGILAKDADDVSMLLLLSDYYGEKGEQLDKAEASAVRATVLLNAATKPEGVTDEDWPKQLSLQKGLALSSLGQVQIQENRNDAAVASLNAAGPLLKSNAVVYARNQYRLAFAFLNLKRTADGRAALAEVAGIDSPYRALAQDKLKSLPPAAGAKKKS